MHVERRLQSGVWFSGRDPSKDKPINMRAGMAPNAMGERNVPIPPRAPFSRPKRQGPDWHYAYPDERNEIIKRWRVLLSKIDFGDAHPKGYVSCRIPLEVAVAIQKELADVR